MEVRGKQKMANFQSLSNKQATDFLFKEIPTKYRKYKAGFLKESWIDGNYLIHNCEDFVTERALEELGVDSKLAQIAIKHHLLAIAREEPAMKTPKKTKLVSSPSPNSNKRKTKANKTSSARSPKMSKQMNLNRSNDERDEEDELMAHSSLLYKYVEENTEEEGFLNSREVLKLSQSENFNFKMHGFKRYTNYLESIPEFRIVKNVPEIRIYLTKDFEKMNMFQNLSKLVIKMLRKNPIQSFQDFEDALQDSDAFMQLREEIPRLEVRQIFSFMPRFKPFTSQKKKMIQDLQGRLNIYMEPIESTISIKNIKERLQMDGFQVGRIDFPKTGVISFKINPPSAAYRVVNKYDGKIVEEFADTELSVTIPSTMKNDDEGVSRRTKRNIKKTQPKQKQVANKNDSLEERKKLFRPTVMKETPAHVYYEEEEEEDDDDMNYTVMESKEDDEEDDEMNYTMMESKEDGDEMVDDGDEMMDDGDEMIHYDPNLMLFMNKLPRKITKQEVIEELEMQGLIVQNKIVITRGFINPLVLETEEQCQQALDGDVMIQGIKAGIQEIIPTERMKIRMDDYQDEEKDELTE